ncbi:uncharacterized protein LOC109715387 [Ananas comosus]|uniref:Uncharacterized protein LOC109715387 n=1 Tax=Ananas comosus TaxID=4615 RepID=A0A6P5FI12_ANACO|nr:uncharacterized protein LOC109715387 [Ananas comosus]
MVDVDRRTPGLPPAHAAGLRRLSSRAAAGVSSSSSGARAGLLSFSALAESLLSHLRSCGVPVLPGLSDAELLRLEAELGLSFPPDLRALLSLGLPSAPGFPDWRSPLPLLLPSLRLPSAALALHSGSAAPALIRSSALLPPALPALAGNPVFRVDDDAATTRPRLLLRRRLADFFRREAAFRSDSDSAPALPLRRQLSAPIPPPPPPSASSARRSLDSSIAGKKPRWIEFWSDAALDRRARASSASSHPPDPEQFLEIQVQNSIPIPNPSLLPDWVRTYLDRIGSVLREGGWGEPEVAEMVHVASSGLLDNVVVVDGEAILDALLLRADRCSDSLRRAGWSSDEVVEALGLGSAPERRRRSKVSLPPRIALRMEKLAGAVSNS